MFLENQNRENQKIKKKSNKQYPRVGLEPLNTLLCFVFPKVCLVFFCVLWYLWFSRMVFGCLKTLGKIKKNNPYPRVGLKPKNFVFFVVPKVVLVFFCICCFPYVFFGFLKTFGKTKKTNKTKPISKGWSETLKNMFFGFP